MKFEASIQPEQAMKLAIEQAWKGIGRVKANPLVGCCIISREGKLLSLGHHAFFGGDHAEIDAIKNIKEQSLLKGATVFVTLEPCSHMGKTPSCAQRLSQLPIESVIYGCEDPHPMGSGGRKILLQQGILCEKYIGLEKELNDLNEVFFHNVRHQKAFIALKVATGLDGSLALKNGESQWITNEASRERAHQLRAQYDATLIGINTYLKDNPLLNIRSPKYKGHKNKIILLDPKGQSLETLGHSSLLKVHRPEDIYIVTTKKTETPLGLHVHVIKTESDTIDLKTLSRDLYRQFLISSILVEGGAVTHSHFINQKQVQKIHQFIAPVILGGTTGINWTQNVEVKSMKDRVKIDIRKIEKLDDNILITGNWTTSENPGLQKKL